MVRNFPSAEEFKPLELQLLVRNTDLSHRVQGFELRFDFEAGSWNLDITFRNTEEDITANYSLDPNDPNSSYNQPSPLLGSYNLVTLKLRKEGDTTWHLFFKGFVGPSSVRVQEEFPNVFSVEASCVGLSQPLKDWMIEKRLALKYENASISSGASPDLLNQIITDQGFNYTIHYVDDPNFAVTKYVISNVSLWQALENALAPTGFRLIEKYISSSDDILVSVKDPIRSKTTPDVALTGQFRKRDITGSEADVRTWVGVTFRYQGTENEGFVWAEAGADIVSKYGIPDGSGNRKHKKMVYRTEERSLVDSESEARELAALILHDLQTPSPDVEISIPRFDGRFEAFDLIQVVGPAYTTLTGLMGISFSWSFDNPYGLTSLQGTVERIIGAKSLWLSQDVKRVGWKEDQLRDLLPEPPPKPLEPHPIGSWYVGPDGTPQPVIDVTFKSALAWWADSRALRVFEFEKLDSGTASGGAASYLEDTSKSWPNGYLGFGRDYIKITSGTGAGQVRRIKSNSATRIYVSPDFTTAPSSGSTYMILRAKRNLRDLDIGIRPYTRITEYREGDWIGIAQAWKPSARGT